MRVYLLMACVVLAESRTIRRRVLTNENGTREVVAEGSDDNEVDSLMRDLNGFATTLETTMNETGRDNGTNQLNEDILMKHWNTLTEVGWNREYRNPSREMDVNSTRVMQLGEAMQTKRARDLGSNNSVPCLQNQTTAKSLQHLSDCLSEIWRKFDEDVDPYLTNSTDSRSLYYRHKHFYLVVLPLFVMLFFKYMTVLPLLIFGIFAVKSLLLIMLSSGAATLHSIAKKLDFFYPRYPLKQYRGVEVDPEGSNLLWLMPDAVPMYENLNM